MSGSSLDGLDIAYVRLEEVRGKWEYAIEQTRCVPYPTEWVTHLRQAARLPVGDFLKLHTAYGRYTGETVKTFMDDHDLEHKVHFIASHGHTVFHEPGSRTTFQLGDGATIASVTGLPVICDLRAMDVALGGQGAPIVPIGDRMLFSGYDYLLNIGGIANVTVQGPNGSYAYDICPANQALNALAHRLGKTMDEGGEMAAAGNYLPDVDAALRGAEYYQRTPPKSLSNQEAVAIAIRAIEDQQHDVKDLLHTMTVHIAGRIAAAIHQTPVTNPAPQMLITGGGAFNTFLTEEIKKQLSGAVSVIVPDDEVVMYKEALVMALIGALRWREEVNVLSGVTGAERDSSGGAIWLP